jgi:hypothetical protein
MLERVVRGKGEDEANLKEGLWRGSELKRSRLQDDTSGDGQDVWFFYIFFLSPSFGSGYRKVL